MRKPQLSNMRNQPAFASRPFQRRSKRRPCRHGRGSGSVKFRKRQLFSYAHKAVSRIVGNNRMKATALNHTAHSNQDSDNCRASSCFLWKENIEFYASGNSLRRPERVKTGSAEDDDGVVPSGEGHPFHPCVQPPTPLKESRVFVSGISNNLPEELPLNCALISEYRVLD